MWRTLLVGAIVCSLIQQAAIAQNLQRGLELLTANCSSCHAIGRTGGSAHPAAPAFRTLSHRYPIESLAEALAEGLAVGHPDMPEFVFETDDIGAVLDYLKSIQER